MSSPVDGGLFIRRTIQADGAPPDPLRGLSGHNFRFTVAHADRGLIEALMEGYQALLYVPPFIGT